MIMHNMTHRDIYLLIVNVLVSLHYCKEQNRKVKQKKETNKNKITNHFKGKKRNKKRLFFFLLPFRK